MKLERTLSDLVNQAYGVTPAEIDLLWKTTPPRMPIPPPATAPQAAVKEWRGLILRVWQTGPPLSSFRAPGCLPPAPVRAETAGKTAKLCV